MHYPPTKNFSKLIKWVVFYLESLQLMLKSISNMKFPIFQFFSKFKTMVWTRTARYPLKTLSLWALLKSSSHMYRSHNDKFYAFQPYHLIFIACSGLIWCDYLERNFSDMSLWEHEIILMITWWQWAVSGQDQSLQTLSCNTPHTHQCNVKLLSSNRSKLKQLLKLIDKNEMEEYAQYLPPLLDRIIDHRLDHRLEGHASA